jgi:small-conductance mechanosensitive channel
MMLPDMTLGGRPLAFVLAAPATSVEQQMWRQLERWIEPLAGGWANRPAFAGVTWLQVIAVGAVLLLTALVSELIRWKARRKIREEAVAASNLAGQPPRRSWFAMTLREAHPPLRLLVWTWGLYLACHFLLMHAPFGVATALSALAWFRRVGLIVAVLWFLYRMVNVLELALREGAGEARGRWTDVISALVVRALRLVVPLIGILMILPSLELPPAEHALLQAATSLILIGFTGFIFCELAATAEHAVLSDFRVDVKDNLAMRKVQTQVKILRKIAVSLIVIVTVALMLTNFDSVRSLGKSILASAGIAGIVIGIAAQKTLATFLAGIQIAFAQPIRLDDVVIVEGEWGRIEEINMTYVVVAIWDLRRMVLPITYFIEKPFQNWTRARADLLGSVFLYLDYTVPIAPLRAELDRILEASKLWDRKVKVLQVTDAKEHTIEIRILASAADSSIAWDLRCEIREKMVDFVQRNFPATLPRTRALLLREGDRTPPGAADGGAAGRAPAGPAEEKKAATDATSSSLGIQKPPRADVLPGEARAPAVESAVHAGGGQPVLQP